MFNRFQHVAKYISIINIIWSTQKIFIQKHWCETVRNVPITSQTSPICQCGGHRPFSVGGQRNQRELQASEGGFFSPLKNWWCLPVLYIYTSPFIHIYTSIYQFFKGLTFFFFFFFFPFFEWSDNEDALIHDSLDDRALTAFCLRRGWGYVKDEEGGRPCWKSTATVYQDISQDLCVLDISGPWTKERIEQNPKILMIMLVRFILRHVIWNLEHLCYLNQLSVEAPRNACSLSAGWSERSPLARDFVLRLLRTGWDAKRCTGETCGTWLYTVYTMYTT